MIFLSSRSCTNRSMCLYTFFPPQLLRILCELVKHVRFGEVACCTRGANRPPIRNHTCGRKCLNHPAARYTVELLFFNTFFICAPRNEMAITRRLLRDSDEQRAYYFCLSSTREINIQQINDYGTKEKSRTGRNF